MPDDYTDVTKNPYFDPNLGSGLAAPRERRPRPLKMAPKGKFTAIANQIRAEERMEQLRKEIEESGQANVKEEDLLLKDGFQKVNNIFLQRLGMCCTRFFFWLFSFANQRI